MATAVVPSFLATRGAESILDAASVLAWTYPVVPIRAFWGAVGLPTGAGAASVHHFCSQTGHPTCVRHNAPITFFRNG